MDDMSFAVAITASHPGMHAALAALVRSDPALEVVGDARRADVLVLALPGALAHGGQAIREARRLAPQTAVLVAGTGSGAAYDAAARAAGAAGHVGPGEDLLARLRAAAARAA
jgi:DNA-binding NarL/FixJ family response regulator